MKVTRTVRFFEVCIKDDDGEHYPMPNDFWQETIQTFSTNTLEKYIQIINETKYLARVANNTPIDHIVIEKIRNDTEQLNQTDLSNFTVTKLTLNGNNHVSESTYIVPLDLTSSKVAVMGLTQYPVSASAIGQYLTSVLKLSGDVKNPRIHFAPIIDYDVLSNLQSSKGAVKIEITVNKGAKIPTSGGGNLGEILRQIPNDGYDELQAKLELSFGRNKGSLKTSEKLLDHLMWAVNNNLISKGKVRPVSEDNQGNLIKEDLQDIFSEKVTKQVTYTIDADKRHSDSEILRLIHGTLNGTSSLKSAITFNEAIPGINLGKIASNTIDRIQRA